MPGAVAWLARLLPGLAGILLLCSLAGPAGAAPTGGPAGVTGGSAGTPSGSAGVTGGSGTVVSTASGGSGGGSGGQAGSGKGTQPGGSGGGQGVPAFYAGYLAVVPYAGSYCVTSAYQAFPTQQQATAFETSSANQQTWLAMLRAHRLCPASMSQPPPPGTGPTPASTVATWWATSATSQLPVPAPSVAPGWAVTGAAAYLVVGAPLAATFTPATPAGPFDIDATGEVYVDWGDGTASGPYHDGGGRWPSGDITHVWDSTGAYTVVVTVEWSAAWSFAPLGLSGSLGGLHTGAVLPGFQVRQLVAVRNR